MNIFIFDFEVYAYDWLFVAKRFREDHWTEIRNDPIQMREWIEDSDPLLTGFNNKHYDNYIMKAVLSGADNAEVKALNDFIIQGNNGWDHPLMKDCKIYFDSCDLMDDTQTGTSLKSYEAHKFMDIEETEVDFNINRPLTESEWKKVIKYCRYDVAATEQLMIDRIDYLMNKIAVGERANIPMAKALGMTNAKLTAKFLKAERHEYNDEREYKFPQNILYDYIPTEVYQFFNSVHDMSIPDDEVFSRGMDLNIGDCECRIAFGGAHGAIPHYTEEASADRLIENVDVASYYPHLMTVDGYASRSMPSVQTYADMLEDRMRAKKSGDKKTADALKLVANTTYGVTLAKFSDLYDPLMARSICITGQLRILELAEHLYKDIQDLKVIQINTDGIMISYPTEAKPQVTEILNEWQSRTGYELETDHIQRIVQKDVNGYIEVKEDGSYKCKGGYLVRGMSTVGAFKINNNANIIAKAIIDYFVSGTSARDTINNCDDKFQFQLIAKGSGLYSKCLHIVEGGEVLVQKCNRVYASNDPKLGTLVKVHANTMQHAKIADIPEHCIIDNKNQISIDEIDREWYIAEAERKINDFLGIKEKKKGKKTMANAQKQNMFERLRQFRKEFHTMPIGKSGINNHAEFDYRELSDIIPAIDDLCEKYNFIFLTDFTGGIAKGTLIDTTDPSQQLIFGFDFAKIAEPAKFRMNEVQARGAEITYARRYLYMILTDDTNKDQIDAVQGKPVKEEPKAEAPKPAVKRKTAKANLTDPDAPMTEQQAEALTKAIKKISDISEEAKQKMVELAEKNDNFTDLTKAKADAILKKLATTLKSLKAKEKKNADTENNVEQ